MKHCTKPCPECPFSRKVEPGTLGGSPPARFVGQAQGPFILPCHSVKGYTPTPDPNAVQCGGAAIFRANTGVDVLMPPVIHRLPADTESVFASDAEFIAHHTGREVGQVQRFINSLRPGTFLHMEMNRSGLRYFGSGV